MFIPLGICWVIQGALHAFGCPYLVPKKYRNSDSLKQYQRELVFPYLFLGVGWLTLGLVYRLSENSNHLLFVLYGILIAIIPLILVSKHEKKYHE